MVGVPFPRNEVVLRGASQAQFTGRINMEPDLFHPEELANDMEQPLIADPMHLGIRTFCQVAMHVSTAKVEG